jgi:hypothetical protein
MYLMIGTSGHLGKILKTTDQWVTSRTLAENVVGFEGFSKHPIRLDPVTGKRWVVAGLDSSGLGVINFSNTDGVTWDGGAVANRPLGFSARGDLGRPHDMAHWPGGGLDIGLIHSADPAANPVVQYSADCETFVDVTGNLETILTGGSWSGMSISFGLPND